ncbi:MAG: hypothetical protein ACO2OQ_04065 [Thermofilaceae archaeon]|jgi:hypothetical protein
MVARRSLMEYRVLGDGFLKLVIQRCLPRFFYNLTQQELEFMGDVAKEDLINYAAYTRGVLAEPTYREIALSHLSSLAEDNPLAFDRMLTSWMEVWSIKWGQRVKLVLSEDQREEEVIQAVEKKASKLVPLLGGLYPQLTRFAVGSLISNGEVCFTNLLADTVVKEVLAKLASSMSIEEAANFARSNPVFLLSEIVQRARALARYKGNLVVLRVNPSFFQEAREEVHEW